MQISYPDTFLTITGEGEILGPTYRQCKPLCCKYVGGQKDRRIALLRYASWRSTTYHVRVFVSVTRLRLRSIRFLPAFLLKTQRTGRQIRAAGGFVAGELVVDRKLTFWTMTGWVDERAMLGYRNSGAHKAVMPKLIQWCDEAAAVHWVQEGNALPSWKEAHVKLKADGFVTKVRHPSTEHATRDFAEPRTTIGQKLGGKQSG